MPPSFPIFAGSNAEARAAILHGLLIAALIIAGLYFGREVLLPLAVAILLSFVLTPPLLLLRKLKVPRVLGVTLVVTFAFVVIVSLGWLLSQQITQLADSLPAYKSALIEKMSVLRTSVGNLPALERASEAVEDLGRELAKPESGSAPAATDSETADKPVVVQVQEAPPGELEVFQTIAGAILSPLATAGIVLIFVVFILLQREELRDRSIRLFASSDVQRATLAMNDAAGRLSRYFLSQLLINSAYGVFIGAALWLLGVPGAIAWGILAALMRFVPYIGSFIAAAPPLLLAAVVEPSWSTFFVTGVLYLVSELAMGQVVEPLVYGHGTGLSPIAVIAATIFWTWIWGPLGLLLAVPFTVCLVVLRTTRRRIEISRSDAGRRAGAYASRDILSAGAGRRFCRNHLSGRNRLEGRTARRPISTTSLSRDCNSPSAIANAEPSTRTTSSGSGAPSKSLWRTSPNLSPGVGSEE